MKTSELIKEWNEFKAKVDAGIPESSPMNQAKYGQLVEALDLMSRKLKLIGDIATLGNEE